jgi:hypothetical protein
MDGRGGREELGGGKGRGGQDLKIQGWVEKGQDKGRPPKTQARLSGAIATSVRETQVF